ncbi:MAG: YwaF family protein [Flavobacteriales bacterium]|nr:YwaF family protein [Flavobacteriales bacterium]
MDEFTVVITASEPRYWMMMGGGAIGGWLVMRAFNKLPEDRQDGGLKMLGWTFIAFLGLGLGHEIFSPEPPFTLHRSLPLQLCGINAWLLAINCFYRNPHVFAFAGFLGIIGGFHSFMTPEFNTGASAFSVVIYTIKHAALIWVPIIMFRTYGLRFLKYAWLRVYAQMAVLSFVLMAINGALNIWWPSKIGAVANYMFTWVAPVADNPFILDWAWPWYLAPLHLVLIGHLLILNAAFRKASPAPIEGGRLRLYE